MKITVREALSGDTRCVADNGKRGARRCRKMPWLPFL